MNNAAAAAAAAETTMNAAAWDAAWTAFRAAQKQNDATGVKLAARKMRNLHLDAGVARERVPAWIRQYADVA